MLHHDSDTIVAPGTPPGEGGIGIIRISGKEAETLLRRIFRPSSPTGKLESHHLYHGRIVDGEGGGVDEVLAVIMRAPRSFTREDVVEIHCHGGSLLIARVLDLLVDYGARLARPGEFTLRAFLNGRLDLARAEAVADLIHARSVAAGKLALRQLDGEVSRAVYALREAVLGILAEIEAWIDFPEEDLGFSQFEHLAETSRALSDRIGGLLSGFALGRALREGLSLLIVGPPNVGKSSLLNVLLGEDRAIVTDIPGTTRDTIEEPLVLGGFPLRLIDTAGIRVSQDRVEAEGIKRTHDKIAGADLLLLVLDGSRPPGSADGEALALCVERPTLLIANKADLGTVALPAPWDRLPRVDVSTHTGVGLDELRQAIVEQVRGPQGMGGQEGVIVSDRRHREALVRCRDSLARFLEGVQATRDPEFLALELREGLAALGEITGETTPDQVLEQIFSRFCIGK